ncbi:MAG: FecR family protein [Bacteroidales bacterium]|nr:FecR family protein [Bacteroidales bacterium]MDD3990199.1 FecR family protein [Bacteroidales bacterium]MDD4639149.1 FecR family protein [Bacteroidales bacterium]
MNKRLLIKHIVGEASESERKEVNEWISVSKRNESYYINLMNLVVYQDISKETRQFFSEEEIKERLKDVKEKIRSKEEFRASSNQVQPTRRAGKYYFAAALAAAILLLISVLLNIYQFNSKEETVSTSALAIAPRTEVINTFYTERGVKGKILLEDSTVVWLNSDSKIIYPEHFSSDARQITFEGEGFFEVKKNSEWPMVVNTAKGMSVKVLGTKFHIKSYRNDDSEQATLFDGKILLAKEVKGEGGAMMRRTIEMIPNETVIFNSNGVELINHNADTTKKVAWKRGELLFEETPMSEVVKMLERWHGAKIVVSDNTVLKHLFTGSFNSESLVQILELLKFTAPVDYKIVDNIVYLRGRKI